MKSRKLFLAIAAILVIVGAWKTSQQKAPTIEITTDQLYPGLLDQLNDAQTLSIESNERNTQLAKSEGGWVVANRDNFPADFAAVKNALIDLAQAKIIEEKTSKPDNYSRIGVGGIDNEDSDSMLVKVSGKDTNELVNLIVGTERTGSNLDEPQYYVRKSDEATALLVEGEVDISDDPQNWMNTDVVNIPAERVSKVTIDRSQDTPVVVTKAKQSDNFFSLQSIPTGFIAGSRAVVSSFGALLLDLKFQNVASAAVTDGLKPRAIVELQTFDGLVAKLEQYDAKKNVYVKLAFEFNPDIVIAPPAEEIPEGEEEKSNEKIAGEPVGTTEESDTDEKNENAPPEPSVADEATKLNDTVAGWVYILPDYKVRLIDKRFGDLIKPAEPEKKEADAKAEAE